MLKPNFQWTGRARQEGLSLVELMIAITLGLLVLSAVVAVFAASSRSFHQNDATEQLQDNARSALDTLGRDLSMAGYYGGIFSASAITQTSTPVPKQDCGKADPKLPPWTYRVASRVEFLDNPGSGSAVAAQFPCLDPAVIVPNSDVVAIRRVAGKSDFDFQPSAIKATLFGGFEYLQTNGVVAYFHQASAGSAPGAPEAETPVPFTNFSFYRYVPRVYYVRNYTRTPNDGFPALCRADFCSAGFTAGATVDSSSCSAGGAAGLAGYYSSCVATGVDTLQIRWGIDSVVAAGQASGCAVDTYNDTPQPNDLASAGLSAQIFLLLQTTQADGTYVDTKTYSFGNSGTIPAANDHFHRRVFSTTVELRNPVGDSGLCS